MAITTRLALETDAAAIARAHTRAWQVAYEGIVPADFLAAIDVDARTENWRQNITEDVLPDGTPSPVNLVAEVDGGVVGFACVGVWRDAPDDRTNGELWAIYAHPDHWGSGAGYALMNASVDVFRAREVATAYLWVLEDNMLARRFYERQGWHADTATKEEAVGGVTTIGRRYSIAL